MRLLLDIDITKHIPRQMMEVEMQVQCCRYSLFLFSSFNFSIPRQSVSMGKGKTIVELCSDDMALSV